MSDIRPLTEQEVFNTVYLHATKPNASRCVKNFDSCAYRNEEGNKCFIGVFIFNHDYNSQIEGERIQTLVRDPQFKNSDTGILLSKNSSEFLTELQGIHDGCKVNRWKEWLICFAEKHKLKVPD